MGRDASMSKSEVVHSLFRKFIFFPIFSKVEIKIKKRNFYEWLPLLTRVP